MSSPVNQQPGRGRRRWRDLTESQQQWVIVGFGLLAIALVVVFVVMIVAWGFYGMLWRLGITAAIVGALWLAWKKRRRLAAAAKAYAEQAAARRAQAQAKAASQAQAAAERERLAAYSGRDRRQTAPVIRFATAAPPPAEAAKSIEWIGPDKAVRLSSFEISRPMTYVVRGSRAGVDEPSLLNAALPVAKNASQFVSPLPYWPSFAQMDADQRWVYLAWMTLGRRQMPPEVGYAFVFFYGLERRALVDQADHQLVFDEVFRLRQLHAAAGGGRFSWSFENYTSSFLWFLVTCFSSNISEDRLRRLAESVREWTEDKLSGFLAAFVLKAQPLPVWAAYVVASQQPGSQRSVVIDRVNAQFRELFAKRYEQRFGRGIDLKSSKREYRYSYKPASSALPGWQMEGPNPLGIKSQFKGLDEIWNSCIEDLRKLSGKLRDGQGEMTPVAWEALPAEIRSSVDHPLTDAICKLVVECTDEENRILIPVSRLMDVFKLGPAAAARKKQTPGDSQMICRHVGFVGYRLEPDAYFTGNAYRTDEKVAAFLKVSDEATDHTRYNAAACMLQLGMVIASADGNVKPEELASISQEIERTFQLNAQEQRRLGALRSLLLAEGPDTKGLNQMLTALTPQMRQGIAKLLLAVVAADGVVTREEMRAVRKCYATLGFEKSEIDGAIETLRAGSTDEPVTVEAGVPAEAGEAIPPAPQEAGFRLNRDTIAVIMKDTEEVARILAAAMTVDQQPAPAGTLTAPVAAAATEPAAALAADGAAPAPASATLPTSFPVAVPGNVLIPTETLSRALAETPVVTTADPTLPARYATFYQMLITRAEWTVQEVETLARQHGLMRSGAIDELNEWATEKFGGQLFIEEGPKLIVEQSYLN